MRRAVLWTTVITALLILALYGVTRGLGLGIDDIPRIVPDFSNKV
jgi:predicted secreted protein